MPICRAPPASPDHLLLPSQRGAASPGHLQRRADTAGVQVAPHMPALPALTSPKTRTTPESRPRTAQRAPHTHALAAHATRPRPQHRPGAPPPPSRLCSVVGGHAMHAAARLLSPYAQEPPWPSKVHGRAAHPASSVDRRLPRAVPAGAGAREEARLVSGAQLQRARPLCRGPPRCREGRRKGCERCGRTDATLTLELSPLNHAGSMTGRPRRLILKVAPSCSVTLSVLNHRESRTAPLGGWG